MPYQEQAPAPPTCVSRETAAPHFIAPPLAPQQQKQRHAPPAQPHKSRLEPVTTLALFHVKHSAPVPTGARTRKHANTPSTHTRRSTADTKRGTASRQHPAQSVTNAHTWAPLTHSPAPQLHKGARAPDTDTPHKRTHRARRPARPQALSPRSPQALTPASPAASARGPRVSARRPRRARSTR